MCSYIHGRVEEWHIPGKQQVTNVASALPIANTDDRMTERSTLDSLGDVSWVQKAALQLYTRNVIGESQVKLSHVH